MKKIFFITFTFCFLIVIYKGYCEENVSYISLGFSINGHIEDSYNLYIIDTTGQNQINFHIKRSGLSEDMIIKEILIDSNIYSQFLFEFRNIDNISDSLKYNNSYIIMAIIKKDSVVKRYFFNSPSQINKYLEISDRILGSRNFMPFRDYMDKLK